MRINDYSNSLFEEMEERLKNFNDAELNNIQLYKNTTAVILQFLARLRVCINDYKFENTADEINFFKNIKPKFLSKLIYNQKIFDIQSRIAFGSPDEIKSFYLKELHKISEFLQNNKEFYLYYRSDSNALDEIYFLRKETDSWQLMNFDEYETDLNFTTIYDHKLSKIIAFESLAEFIKEAISKVELRNGDERQTPVTSKQKVNWTASKVSLIELLYALQSSGACNNGSIDIKQLAGQLEHFFNIDLGNYYRVFQEMRIRKISRTSFLDQLKERLVHRMDEQDENPKRYL